MIDSKPTLDLHEIPAVAPHVRWDADQERFWTFEQVLRLVIIPVSVTLFLAGGVLWIHQQTLAGALPNEETSTVEVRILPRPALKPIPLTAVSQPVRRNPDARVTPVADKTDTPPVAEASLSATDDLAQTADAPAVPDINADPAAFTLPPSNTVQKFQQALFRQIERHERYPAAAQRDRLQGSVETLFVMNRDGTVLSVQVKTSSGQAMLDEEAMKAIRRAQPLPPIPADLPDHLRVRLTIAFSPT